jgi:Tfp pilus assembly protein PilF
MKPNFKAPKIKRRRSNILANFILFCLVFVFLAFAAYYFMNPNDKEKLARTWTNTKTKISRLFNKSDNSKPKLAEKTNVTQTKNALSASTNSHKLKTNTEAVRLPGQKLNPTVAEVVTKADNYFVSKRLPQAYAEYKKILEMKAKDQSDKHIAYAHHQLAMLSIMTNSPKTAIDEFELAAEIDPKSSQIQNNLGLTYQSVGEVESALNHFERAFALDPKSVDAAVNLSNVLCQRGNFATAETVLLRSVYFNPKSAKAHNNLGTVLCSQSKYLDSMGEFEKAIALDPAMASAHYGLGFSMMKVKDYMPAIKEFKQALYLNGQLTEASTKIQQAYRQAVLVNTASCN